MLDSFYSLLDNFISRHRSVVVACIGVIILLCAFNLPRIKYNNDIETMLPASREIVRDLRFLRESGFSGKVVLSLGLTSSAHTTEELIRATDALAASLKGPLVTSVTSGISVQGVQEQIRSFLKFTPQMISANDLDRLKGQLTLEGVDRALRLDYHRLLTPAGTFLAPFIQQDPLRIRDPIFLRLQKLSAALGYGVVVESSHFMSKDGRHTLLIIDTPVFLTDGFGARTLVRYLTGRIKALPAYVEAKVIAGHMHSVSNEDVIKRDIVRTSTIAAIAFALIFFFAFRDIRAIIFFLIPLASVVIAINLTGAVFPSLSYFVIGMGAVIVGIADDYGIHAYVAVHTGKKREAVRLIAKPLFIAALTTSSVFASFFFSRMQGYRQLAFFATASIFLCLGFVLFIFPHFLHERGGLSFPVTQEAVPSIRSDRSRVVIWCAVIAVFLFFSTKVRFSSDILQFDGSKKEVLAAEEDFKRTWGMEEQPAMLVSTGKSEEEAIETAEAVVQRASGSGEHDLVAFVSLWPSLKARSENALRWKQFWKDGAEDSLKGLIAQLGPKYNFSKDAFAPFFDGLYDGLDAQSSPADLQFFSRLKERFVQRRPDGYQVISFFPDRESDLARIRALTTSYPGTFVVSRKSLSQSISSAMVSEVWFLSVVAVALILFLTFLLLKDLKLTLISLISVISALIVVFGTFALCRLPLNAAALIAAIVVVGLCIDYGVFMLYSYQHALHTGTVKAVWVSASTTLIGASSLLFASHPVLFSIGLTLVAGLSAGFLASQYVVPALYRVWIGKKA